jgi:acetyl-CoA carboxylase biotin carboxylase subunit
MFDKILIANRGEIACRVAATARRLGIRTVAVYSDVDAQALHVELCDEAIRIGPAAPRESYLKGAAIIDAAKRSGAQAIHPGYGFLSENETFAADCARAGVIFIGPPPAAIAAMGSKSAAKAIMARAGVPIVPGYHDDDQDPALLAREAARVGFPVLIKATAGGGGRGMKVARSEADLVEALQTASKEAGAAFGNDAVYIEKYLEKPRHIELQVFGDGAGRGVHFGERDCSLQRRHQKILEESPSPALNAASRKKIGETVAAAMRKIKYRGAGTVEFLFEDGEFYFIEMNTRLQVEHPVTEAVTGIDLVLEQLRVASGANLSYKQEDIVFAGHAIECRINAENPRTFRPSPGQITYWHPPGGLGVRVDSGIYQGYRIPPFYDSLIGKLIVHGKNRNECLMRLRRALSEFVIDGIETTIPLFNELIRQPDIANGLYDIHWLEKYLGSN